MGTERDGHPSVAAAITVYVGEEKPSAPALDRGTRRSFNYDVPHVGQLEVELATTPDFLAEDIEEGTVLTPIGGVNLPIPEKTPYRLNVIVDCVNETVKESLQLALVLDGKRYRGIPDKYLVGAMVYFDRWVDETNKRGGSIYFPQDFDPSQIKIEYSIHPSRSTAKE